MNESISKTRPSWWIRLLHPKVSMPMLLLLALLCGPFFYRAHHLSQIPDPGDPFDVEAFIKASHVADADNAFIDFQKASSMMPSKLSYSGWDQLFDQLLSRDELSTESQDAIKYVKRNELAILAWKKGTTKPDYSQGPLEDATILSAMTEVGKTREFHRFATTLALLAWQAGDYEESAGWYMVSFHTSRLIQQHGPVMGRSVIRAFYGNSAKILICQLQDKKIPQGVLKKLLEEVISVNDATPLLSDCLKVEYLTTMNSKKFLADDFGTTVHDLSPALLSWYYYLHGEPEVYLRVEKQWIGNVLPEIDRSRFDRSVFTGSPDSPLLFNPTANRSNNRKQMRPEDIDRVWNRPSLIMRFRPLTTLDLDDRYRMTQRLLEATLKLEIYRRQYGKYPSTLEDVYPEGEVPVDVFDPQGGPIKYARDADDASRIWSNGVDEINNGGTTFTNQQDDKDCGYYLGKEPK